MPRPMPTPRLDIPPFHHTTLVERDYESPSPYPPSSPSVVDSDDDETYSIPLSSHGLRSSITLLSEAKLRAIMIKLADTNPYFQRAIAKELAYAQPLGDSSPTTPTLNNSLRQRKRSRTKSSRRRNLSSSIHDRFPCTPKPTKVLLPPEVAYQAEYVYHPGHLEEEVYEFLSRSPTDDVAFQVVRTITMWSCCDEDEWSPGCMASDLRLPLDNRLVNSACLIDFTHPDVFPDSDLERRSEDVYRYSSLTSIGREN